jgi:hypothetical protein
MPSPLPMGAPKRHHAAGAGIDQPLRNHRVIRGIRQNREALLDQYTGSLDGGGDIRIQRLLIADDFDFHPVGKPDFAPQARRADGIVGGVAAGRVRQQKIFFGIDEVKKRFLRAVKIDAADSDRDHLGAAGLQGLRGFFAGLVFPSTHN